MKILIGSAAYLNAVNTDFQIEVGLTNQSKLFDEDILTEIIDESVQFNTERYACSTYLIYGKIENIIDDSLPVNNFLVNDTNYNISLGYAYGYEALPTYQYPILSFTGNNLTIIQDNDFLKDDVVVLYSGATSLYIQKVLDSDTNIVTLDSIPTGITLTNFSLIPAVAEYKRIFTPLYTNNYLKFYNSAFSVYIFDNQIYQFNSYKDINLSGLTNIFGLPVTDIFLNLSLSGYPVSNFYNSDNSQEGNLNVIDIVQYDLNNILETIVDTTYYSFTNSIGYYYYPWIDFTYQVFSQQVVNVTSGTSYDYPPYSFIFSDGDIVYKDLLPLGFMENNTNGVNYPFMNNLQYLYTDIKFPIRRTVPIYDYTTTSLIDTGTTFYNSINTGGGDTRLC